MYSLSHCFAVRLDNKGGAKLSSVRSLILAGILTLLPFSVSPVAQQLDSEYALIGNSYRLEQPSSMTISPSGEQMAVADLGTNLIVVADLYGKLLWVAGEQTRLEQPQALCFISDDEILFVPANEQLVLKVTRDTPSRIDTVAHLEGMIDSRIRLDQILRANDGTYLVLDRSIGEIYQFDGDWSFKQVLVKHGSGREKLLNPSSMALSGSGKLVLADRRNYPLQVLDRGGKFLFFGGWNLPSGSRGWEAAAVAVDSREYIWAADDTNSLFRIFDPIGTEVSSVPFSSGATGPIAMAGTIDNRVVVLDQTGTLQFYTLE